MSAELHLPSLSITGFRGIKNLSIPRLGRVTLFVGKNGVGKTTLLDAVRVYAACGRYPVLAEILRGRDELTNAADEDGHEMFPPDFEAIFHGRDASSNDHIGIGPAAEMSALCIEAIPLDELDDKDVEELKRNNPRFPDDDPNDEMKVLKVDFQGTKQVIPMGNLYYRAPRPFARRFRLDEEAQLPSQTPCECLGPGLLSNTDLARFWDKVALTDDEILAVDALNLIFGDTVSRVAVVGDNSHPRSPHGRRAMVKLKEQERPVPLKSLGDGAVRLFGVALALANSQGGFLTLDEAENGLHYSVQQDLWRMVLSTAQKNDVQVLATTHGWDCATAFAQAAVDVDEADGVLIRLERTGGEIRTVEYLENDLKIAAEQGIEVR